MAQKTTGGCFCGGVRYEVSGEPVFQLFCFCRDCLSTSGTDGYAGYMVNEADFRLVQGQPAVYRKTSKAGRSVDRHFCAECGSNLWGLTELGLVSVVAGSLDDPSVFQPSKTAFVADAPLWARIPEDLEEM